MPGRLQSVPGTNTIYATMQASLPRPCADDTVLWTVRWSSWVLRGIKTGLRARRSWTFQRGRWPYANRMSFCGDPAAPASGILQGDVGNVSAIGFEPRQCGPGGTPSLKFIMGKCKDASGVAIGGAVVQGFRTTNDQFVRETQADDQGNYELGTEYPGEGHYLVAYSAGSPDRTGATVNTLVGTNRDGS